MLKDERGSVIAYAGGSGSVLNINTYDEYGVPGAANAGRFQYTGQMWLPDAGVYHDRARTYAPGIGRFLQPDPMGYAAGMGLYAYVSGDPINFTDPFGFGEYCDETGCYPVDDITVTGSRRPCDWWCRGGQLVLRTSDYVGGLFSGGGTASPTCTAQAFAPSPGFVAPPAALAPGAVATAGGMTAGAAASAGAVATLPFFLSGDSAQPRPQYVIRGDVTNASNLIGGTTSTPFANAPTGFSVTTSPGMSVQQLAMAARYPNNQISYTTVAGLASVGARVVPTPTGNNPLHATAVVPNPLSPAQAAAIAGRFRPSTH